MSRGDQNIVYFLGQRAIVSILTAFLVGLLLVIIVGILRFAVDYQEAALNPIADLVISWFATPVTICFSVLMTKLVVSKKVKVENFELSVFLIAVTWVYAISPSLLLFWLSLQAEPLPLIDTVVSFAGKIFGVLVGLIYTASSVKSD